MTNASTVKVLVLGGGFAGLETSFYLKWKGKEKIDVTLISDQDYFLYKPNLIYVPFGLNPETLKIALPSPTKRKNIRFLHAGVREIDTEKRSVLADGQKLNYDFLVVATGAGMRATEVAGLNEYAETIWTAESMLHLRSALASLLEVARAGKPRQVLFLIPPNNKCAGPLYEIVLMLDTWLRRHDCRRHIEIVWTTYEETYIQAFGPRLHEVVSGEFERRGIKGFNKLEVDRVEKDRVTYRNGHTIPFDLLISFPPYVAATTFPGLPSDPKGFITTELGSRQVSGHPEIYAVGDAGDFPVKQAFLAFLQADAAAEHLVGTILGENPESRFEPKSMCVMEQFDKATFAQVPLRLTGSPTHPIEVAPDQMAAYRVGSSPIWRLGKKLLSIYLPWRFRAGNPFHAGLPWRGMEAGLKLMSSTLAH